MRFCWSTEEQSPAAFIVYGSNRFWCCSFMPQEWWKQAFAATERVLGAQ